MRMPSRAGVSWLTASSSSSSRASGGPALASYKSLPTRLILIVQYCRRGEADDARATIRHCIVYRSNNINIIYHSNRITVLEVRGIQGCTFPCPTSYYIHQTKSPRPCCVICGVNARAVPSHNSTKVGQTHTARVGNPP